MKKKRKLKVDSWAFGLRTERMMMKFMYTTKAYILRDKKFQDDFLIIPSSNFDNSKVF